MQLTLRQTELQDITARARLQSNKSEKVHFTRVISVISISCMFQINISLFSFQFDIVLNSIYCQTTFNLASGFNNVLGNLALNLQKHFL